LSGIFLNCFNVKKLRNVGGKLITLGRKNGRDGKEMKEKRVEGDIRTKDMKRKKEERD
jgi:hypothetical protein